MDEKQFEALQRLQIMNVDESMVISPFKDGCILMSERVNKIFCALLSSIEEDDILKAKIQDFEQKYQSLVYHVQLTHTSFGDCYSFFYVSNQKDEWEYDRNDLKEGYPIVYVWNRTNPEFSEFGSIGFKTALGGVLRTA